jgi:hypothetical protein
MMSLFSYENNSYRLRVHIYTVNYCFILSRMQSQKQVLLLLNQLRKWT